MKFFTHSYNTLEDLEKATEAFFKDNVRMVSMTFVPYSPEKIEALSLSTGLMKTFVEQGEFIVMWQRFCRIVKEDTCSICRKTDKVYYCELHNHWVCMKC